MPGVTPKALVLCERSLIWSKALLLAGYRVTTYDLLPPLAPVPAGVDFRQEDALSANPAGCQVCIAFPPCTDLSAAGAVFWPTKASAGTSLAAAALLLAIADKVYQAPRGLIENPRGLAFRLLGRPSLVVDPWMYALTGAENRRKRTAIWLHNWPPPLQVFSDATAPARFMSWASGRCQTTRARSWPGMAAAFVAALPRPS